MIHLEVLVLSFLSCQWTDVVYCVACGLQVTLQVPLLLFLWPEKNLEFGIHY